MRRAVFHCHAAAMFALALSCGLAAAPARADPDTGPCRQDAALFALGQPYSEDLADRARRAAGAKSLRKIEPGHAYTMEFRGDRLNLEVDSAGRVISVRCG